MGPTEREWGELLESVKNIKEQTACLPQFCDQVIKQECRILELERARDGMAWWIRGITLALVGQILSVVIGAKRLLSSLFGI